VSDIKQILRRLVKEEMGKILQFPGAERSTPEEIEFINQLEDNIHKFLSDKYGSQMSVPLDKIELVDEAIALIDKALS
tara:strand:+ start:1068 stop:1301 length:234 start_codon:yes stop_codon:yes gene_type:complete